MIPKGKLLIIGGHEDKGEIKAKSLTVQKKGTTNTHPEILGSLISDIPRAHHIIEIIASASYLPEEAERNYIRSYKDAGFTKVGFIKLESKEDANDLLVIKRVQGAHAVFFTGGDQNRLINKLKNTGVLKAIKKKYLDDKNFIVCGTSAGAMVMPEIIITGGIIGAALFKGDIKINKGFDLIKGIIIDTHFIKRGRFARLAHAITLNPACLGIGLEEDTALIISEGNKAECIGSGMVILIDGNHIHTTNIHTVDKHTPIIVENLKVSIIAERSQYLILERKLVTNHKSPLQP